MHPVFASLRLFSRQYASSCLLILLLVVLPLPSWVQAVAALRSWWAT
jgi:hypothetical protein